MSLAADLQQRWYSDARPPWWTLPLAALYGGVTRVRRALYRRGILHATRLPVPVIVVGNLVAGGAGKTPLTIALVEALRERGLHPGVVSRGYGGAAREPTLLDEASDAAMVGDEPLLIHARTGVPVAVGAKRADAARLLPGSVDVIVADDGLQHYALARDIELCVIDGERRFGNGRLLPAGPLRERVTRLRAVDFVVCNGGSPQPGEVSMQLVMGAAVMVDASQGTRALAHFAGQRVHAVAGIGHPARFFAALRAAGMTPVEHAFPDHHRYAPQDFAFGDELPVLMTEKDAVKCRAFARPGWWAVPVRAVLPATFLDAVAARVAAVRVPPHPAA